MQPTHYTRGLMLVLAGKFPGSTNALTILQRET